MNMVGQGRRKRRKTGKTRGRCGSGGKDKDIDKLRTLKGKINEQQPRRIKIKCVFKLTERNYVI